MTRGSLEVKSKRGLVGSDLLHCHNLSSVTNFAKWFHPHQRQIFNKDEWDLKTQSLR